MGICPIRCRSSMSILENASESATAGTQVQMHRGANSQRKCDEKAANKAGFVSVAHQDAITVSLCDYPAFGHADPTMCIGEQLTVQSEWVALLWVFHLLPFRFDLHVFTTDVLGFFLSFFPQQRWRLSDRQICHDGPGELRSHHLHRQGDSHVSPRVGAQQVCVCV